MAKFSRDYTKQAKFGMVLSIGSMLGVVALIVLLGRNMSWSDMSIGYGNKLYGTAVYLAGLATLAVAVAGFWLGMTSWGEKRNESQRSASVGFFIGAIAICLTIILLAFFMLRSQVLG